MSEQSGKSEMTLGFNVGRLSITAACIDGSNAVVEKFDWDVEPDDDGFAAIGKAIELVEGKCGKAGSIGVAIPGLVESASGNVVHSTLFPEYTEKALSRTLQKFTDARIVTENDANAAAVAEVELGAGRGSGNVFYVTLGDGVGGALILNGRLWRGVSGFAGEVGYFALNSEGTKLDEVASTNNIIRRTKNWFHQDHTSSLNLVGEDNITLGDVIEAAEDDDDFAQLMLQRTGIYVGTAVAGVINLLNLEKVVVGGEIMEARHLVLNGIVQRARELSYGPSFEAVEIVEGTLGRYAGAIGAALISSGRFPSYGPTGR